MGDRARLYMLEMQALLHRKQMGRSMMLEDAVRAQQRDKAKAHVNYRRALERATSKTVQINRKYRPAILRRQKDGEGNER